MRYYVTIDETTFVVDVDGSKVTVDGQVAAAELLRVTGTPVRRLSLNGTTHRVVAERGARRGEWDLRIGGARVTADVVDERTRAIRTLTAGPNVPQGPRPVRAPMPGMIVRVEVEAGDVVHAGQGVVIMEAMKMENELKADSAGVVSRVAVRAGDPVEKGAILIELTDGRADG